MVFHFLIFLITVLASYAKMIIVFHHTNHEEKVSLLELCRGIAAENGLVAVNELSASLVICLFTFMSIKFSKPSNGYWKHMLIYKGERMS